MKFKFDLIGIIIMIIAIAIGQFVSSGWLIPMLGSIAGGIIGSAITGLVIYAIYTFLTGGRFGLMNAIIFIVVVYVANLLAGYVAAFFGAGSGYISLVVAGVFASFLWGWVGGKQAKKTALKPKLPV